MSHLYVATNGLSVWSSSDLGETLVRMLTGTGMYSGSQVWALALHPSLPHVLLAGTNTGITAWTSGKRTGTISRPRWTTRGQLRPGLGAVTIPT